MTLTIHTEQDDQCQLKVTVEVPEARVQAQMREAARELAREVSFPGFRKGKVPYNILVRRVGEEALRADAVEEMLEAILEETLEQIEAVPFRQPSLDKMEMTPLVLKLTIPLEPVVKLADYRAIRKDLEPVEVTEEALAESLEHIRSHHQVLELVERPAELGDMVTVSGVGKALGDEEEEIWHEHDVDIILDADRVFPGLPFIDNIVGLSAGEEKNFRFIFPEDYEDEDLAGREAEFELTLTKVQSRELPELSDELAQKEGNYETLEVLRERLSRQLFEQAEQTASSELVDQMVDEMLAEAELLYPPVVVESELDEIEASFKTQITRSGMKWEDYLKLDGQTEESLRESWREEATNRVRKGLVLRQFVTEERLVVEQADIDAAIEERLNQFADNEELREQLRSIFMKGPSFERMQNDILVEKTAERMKAIVSGNAPDLEAIAVEAELSTSDEEE